jgi:adenylate cyclase class 2
MRFEVEQKHPVRDREAFVAQLDARGVAVEAPVVQVDRYFAHPARDFARTDEALRIRTVGGTSFVTYKGPKLDDRTTKTRREIELPLDANDVDGSAFAELLTALGFTPVAEVHKERRQFVLPADDGDVHGALDDVAGLGTYVELELLADDTNLEAAKRAVTGMAEGLQLAPREPRSYLEMLLQR